MQIKGSVYFTNKLDDYLMNNKEEGCTNSEGFFIGTSYKNEIFMILNIRWNAFMKLNILRDFYFKVYLWMHPIFNSSSNTAKSVYY